MNPERDAPYWQQRQENDQFIKATSRRYAKKIQAQDVGATGEEQVDQWLRQRGLIVEATAPNAPYDRKVTDPATGRTIRVEIKTSTYNKATGDKGGRYQARIHHSNADLVIFVARNGRDWPFIIPMADIAGRRNVAIWSKCPANYKGQWSRYLEAWQNLQAAF